MYQNIYTMKKTKKLKILLLTDRLTLGGAETHIISLYRSLTDLGHSLTVVSCGGELSENIKHVSIDLSAHSPIKLIRGYFALCSLVSKEKFDLIHAHARLPALVASFVAKKFKIPLVTTVHARFRSDWLRCKLSSWGFRSIAVSEDLRIYLSQNYSICSENISVIENGIDFKYYRKAEPCVSVGSPPRLLFLSRLDADCSLCAELLCELAPRLAERYGDIQIIIGGGGECFDDIKARANSINARIGKNTVLAVGEVTDVPRFLRGGDAFVGVSRAALEALAVSIPIVIAGNEGFLGRLTMNNFSYALAANFCARGEALPDVELLFKSLCSVLDNYSEAKSEAKLLCERACSLLDMSVVAPKYEEFYFRVLAEYANFNQKNPRTLLFGYYGFSNLGDDALLRASIIRARKEFGGAVGAFTHSPKKSARIFAVPCYSRTSIFSLFYRLSKCERLIFGGGTLFQDRTSRRSLLYYIFILRLALFLKKDVLLYANGIGEICEGRLRSILFKLLSDCSYIGARDLRSFEILRQELLPSAKIIFEEDLALSLPSSSSARACRLLFRPTRLSSASFFAVCPHCRASRFDCFELELAIRKRKNMGEKPIFISCSPEDFDIIHGLTLKFGGTMISNISFSDLLAIFPYVKCVISMRYHPLLAARACSVEFLSIGSDSKLDEFR